MPTIEPEKIWSYCYSMQCAGDGRRVLKFIRSRGIRRCPGCGQAIEWCEKLEMKERHCLGKIYRLTYRNMKKVFSREDVMSLSAMHLVSAPLILRDFKADTFIYFKFPVLGDRFCVRLIVAVRHCLAKVTEVFPIGGEITPKQLIRLWGE